MSNTDLEARLRELHDANPINEGEDVESCWGECWVEDIIRTAAAIGDEIGYARGIGELHAVALKFAADLMRMGVEENCPGGREHIDREEVVERTMTFKHDIDAIRARAAAQGKEGG